MEIKKILLTLVVVIFTASVNAQKKNVNTEKSTIHWLGKKIGGQHDGFIKLQSGFLDLEGSQILSGTFVMDMTSMTNSDLKNEEYNQKLIGHLMSDDFFGVKKFPTATLEIIDATKFSGGQATVTGNLTIKGKTESITFDVMNDGKNYSAKLEIDRAKFDVKYGSTSFFKSLGDKAINDIFTLDINILLE